MHREVPVALKDFLPHSHHSDQAQRCLSHLLRAESHQLKQTRVRDGCGRGGAYGGDVVCMTRSCKLVGVVWSMKVKKSALDGRTIVRNPLLKDIIRKVSFPNSEHCS